MNNLRQYMTYLMKGVLAALLLVPALGWSHGMMDIPNTRQGICINAGNYSWPPDGSGITPGACKTAAMIWTTPAERLYPLSQWHEFASNVVGHRDLEKLKAHIPDGSLCSAGDSKKKGFDLALSDWQKTPVTVVNGKMTIRIVGSQPHVPSYVRVFLTRPGYQATAPLKWSDLQLIATEEFSTFRTDWAASVAPKPSFIPAVIGFFEFEVSVPNGQSGDAILYTYWQREDTGNEGFGGCADITLGGAVVPSPWTAKGQFVAPDIAPKLGETVRVRVFGANKGFTEIVDESLKINDPNVKVWAVELKDLLAKHAQTIQVGELKQNHVIFDHEILTNNQFYVSNKDYGVQMSVIGDTGPPPTPQARISGETTLTSGKTYSFKGMLENPQNNAQGWHWAANGIEADKLDAPEVTGVAVRVATPTKFNVDVNVRDGVDGKTYQASLPITINPNDSGGDKYPQWIRDGGYNSGAKVSNYGTNYVCKSGGAGAWCGQNENEPGKPGSEFWQRAWDPAP